MTEPGAYDITIYQGATFQRVLTWKAADVPVDNTFWSAKLQMRRTVPSPDPPLFELTTENGGITLGGSDGTITLYISADDTALIDWEEARYDLKMISPDEDVERLLQGGVYVSPEVTRDSS